MPDRQELLVEVADLRAAANALAGRLGIAQRQVRLLLAVVAALALLALVVTVLVIRGIGETKRINNQVRDNLVGSCSFWRDLSALPLNAKSTKTSFAVIADSRVAYFTLGCASHGGELPKPDPRVAPYLPPALRRR